MKTPHPPSSQLTGHHNSTIVIKFISQLSIVFSNPWPPRDEAQPSLRSMIPDGLTQCWPCRPYLSMLYGLALCTHWRRGLRGPRPKIINDIWINETNICLWSIDKDNVSREPHESSQATILRQGHHWRIKLVDELASAQAFLGW